MRDFGGTRRGITGHVASRGEPDVGGGPDREKWRKTVKRGEHCAGLFFTGLSYCSSVILLVVFSQCLP